MSPVDRWSGGDAYERYVGRWSRQVAPIFVDWLAVEPGRRWLDLGCGTGALTATILERAAPASVVGIDPSADFVEHARGGVPDRRASFAVGSAQAIPLDDANVDVAVAGLVLNFVPEPAEGLAEMVRVTAPGGIVAAYVWDYAEGMQLVRHFFDAAITLDPAATAEDEGVRFPFCRPEPLRQAFAAAGLDAVEVRAIEIATVFANFDEYWTPFLSGVGAAPAMAMRMEEGQRNAIRDRLRVTLPTEPDGSIRLSARAWAARGTVS
ncbi:MAG TPA: class I SAM-dependent methyltransferase [Candidatus Limnocylindrales bacterium]|nr:class I SAM-dependent methyltransferase [Candidatus Limnocylindrales bacterium]